LAGMDLGGRLNLNLALAAPRGGQAAEFTFAATDLRIGAAGTEPITMRRLAVNGALSDLLRRPSGRLEASGDHMAASGARIDTLRLAARSSETASPSTAPLQASSTAVSIFPRRAILPWTVGPHA
jgi:hypothetical protein